MTDSTPTWTYIDHPDKLDGHSLIKQGGRWIVNSVVVASVIVLVSIRLGPFVVLGGLVAIWLATTGIVIGIRKMIIGSIKYARETRDP